MTDNKLLFWSLVAASAYWLTALVLADYHSTFASTMLIVFGGVTLLRYGPEAWKVVVNRLRNPQDPYDGSHLSVYGVALLSFGSVYVGIFGIAWILTGQPASWLATPVSGFGRYLMAAGFALLFFSPDIEERRLRLSGSLWMLIVMFAAIVCAFFVGMRMGASETPEYRVMSCPRDMPVKGSRAGLYHPPGGTYYERTIPKACFQSTRVAQSFGFRDRRE